MVVIIFIVFTLAACKNKALSPNDRLKTYIESWNEQQFDKMFKRDLSTETKETYNKKDYVDRYEKIYKDLQIKNVKIDYKPLTEEEVEELEEEAVIPLQISFDTIAGPISYNKKIHLRKEEREKETDWYIDWNPGFILPDLKKEDKVKIYTTDAKRGIIFDRHKTALATNGNAYEVGIVPGKLGENSEAVKYDAARYLGISVEEINEKLEASWVQPDYFVPLKKIATNREDILMKLQSLPGIATKMVATRVYPYEDAAAHLIGYVGAVTEEDMKEHKDEDYGPTSIIGKRGLEQVYEKELRGESGVQISIENTDGENTIIAETEPVDGENIHLTIDIETQKNVYEQMKGGPGTAAAINPLTGEVLSLVSAPSFNPNDLTLGMSAADYKKLENQPGLPLINRFALSYAPGSTIKPITGAIALKKGTTTLSESIVIKGKKWQKQNWGDHYVSRVSDTNGPVNMERAMVLSDNIYFAQMALRMGGDQFIEGLKEFGFEDNILSGYPLKKSQISNNGKLGSEGLIADTAYGQGELQMNILHLAMTYTPFVNKGNLLKPVLLQEEKQPQYWRENLLSEDTAAAIADMMRKVVADPRGTGRAANIPGFALAGKTGTAELKAEKGAKGAENGVFVAYNAENPKLLVAMLIENVHQKGGSGIVIDQVADIFKAQAEQQ